MYNRTYAALDAARNVVTRICPIGVVTIQGTCSHSSVARAQGYSMGNVGVCFCFSLVIVRGRLPRPSVNLVTSAYIVSSIDVYTQQRGVGVRF